MQELYIKTIAPFLGKVDILISSVLEHMHKLNIEIAEVKGLQRDCEDDLRRVLHYADHYISSIDRCLTNAGLKKDEITLMKTQFKEQKCEEILEYLSQIESDYKETVILHKEFKDAYKTTEKNCKHAVVECEKRLKRAQSEKTRVYWASFVAGAISFIALVCYRERNEETMIINLLIALLIAFGTYFIISQIESTVDSAGKLLNQFDYIHKTAANESSKITDNIFKKAQALKTDVNNVNNNVKGKKGFKVFEKTFDFLLKQIKKLEKIKNTQRDYLEKKLGEL